MVLATVYCGESIRVAWQHGMEAVVELPEWAEVLERNPGNRQRFLALDRQDFIATLERWMAAYCPVPGSVVPGVTDAELGRLDVPSLVFRSGSATRITHGRRPSDCATCSPIRRWSSRPGATTSGSCAVTRRVGARAIFSSVGHSWPRNCSTSPAERRAPRARCRTAPGPGRSPAPVRA